MSEIKELYNRKDQMIHFTLADGMVRGLLCTAVNTVAEGAAIHSATPVVAAALGRTLMGIYQPTKGKLVYDGRPVAHSNKKDRFAFA